MRLAWLSIVAAAACGYPPLDLGADGSHRSGGDGGGSSGTMCPLASSFTVTQGTQMAEYSPAANGQPDTIGYLTQVDNASPQPDYVELDLWDTYAPFQSGFDPVTTQITSDFANCGACAYIELQCTDCFNSDATETGLYEANAGTLSITAISSSLTGTLTNATFIHVTDPPSGDTPVAFGDGCMTTIASLSFSASIQQ
jgi:hypothetical protein